MEIGSGGSEENAHIAVFGGCPKMAADENARIIVNPSAAGTDWEDFGVAGSAYIVVNRAPQCTEWKESAPQAQIGSGGRRRRMTGEAGHLSCRVKSYFELRHLSCKGIARGGASLYIKLKYKKII